MRASSVTTIILGCLTDYLCFISAVKISGSSLDLFSIVNNPPTRHRNLWTLMQSDTVVAKHFHFWQTHKIILMCLKHLIGQQHHGIKHLIRQPSLQTESLCTELSWGSESLTPPPPSHPARGGCRGNMWPNWLVSGCTEAGESCRGQKCSFIFQLRFL